MEYRINGVQLTPEEVTASTIQEHTDDGFVPRKEILAAGELIGRRRNIIEADLSELAGIDAVNASCLKKMEARARAVAGLQEQLTDIACGDIDIAGEAEAFLSQRQGDD